MKTRLPLIVGTLFGLYAVVEFYIPYHGVGWLTEQFRSWAIIMAAFAYVLGAVNILQVTWPKIRRREADWPYKVVMLAGAAVMLLVGLPWHRLGTVGAAPEVSIAASADGSTGVIIDAPDDVTALVDGALAPAAHGARPVMAVAPGELEIKLSRRVAGYAPLTTKITLAPGQVATVRGDPSMLWGKEGI